MAVMTGRTRAPELGGRGGWINISHPLSLVDLRGRVVLLGFWTFCCINCLRIIEEVRPLEERFGDRLVVIGVHSPKFPHEQDHEAVVRAVERHRIHHPVLDDPELETWQLYGVRAWPTLVVIDPDGYVVAQAAGEGSAASLASVIDNLLAGRETAVGSIGTSVPQCERVLSFPGKVASDGHDLVAIADTGHDRVVISDVGGKVVAELDGFHQPQGVRFDGHRLLVCDTVAGALIRVDLDDGDRRVLADGMHSPWDVAVLPDGALLIAEAGLHRLLRVPPDGGKPAVAAGSGAEGLRDGAATTAHLAQPSGLTVLRDGTVAFADAEVSALRVLHDGRVETLAGSGLFDWGNDDGPGDRARLQHPLGVAATHDGDIAVADTFNSRLRRWRNGVLETLRVDTALDEPGGIDELPDGNLLVADTNNHRVLTVDPATGMSDEMRLHGFGEAGFGRRVAGARGSRVRIPVSLDLDGEALDSSSGPPVRISASAEPESLLQPGAIQRSADRVPPTVEVELGKDGSGTLTVEITAATCNGDVCTVRRRRTRHRLVVTAAKLESDQRTE